MATYLATEEGRRGLMLALITEVAQAYLELVNWTAAGLWPRQPGRLRIHHTLFSKRYGRESFRACRYPRSAALSAAEARSRH